MSNRPKDDNSEHRPHRVITLTPDNAVHPGGAVPQPTPLTVDETVEVLKEIDRLSTQVRGLTAKIAELRGELKQTQEQLEAKDRALAALQSIASQTESRENAPENASKIDDQEGGETARLKSPIEAKDAEIAELKDKYLRTLADSENAKRRIRQQSEDSVRVQRENLLRDLLPIVDNLERAIAAAKSGSGDGQSIVKGVEMVLTSLLDFLKAHGVKPQPAVGQQFDPARHEAADHVASDNHPPNSVVEEFHRGYSIGDKVLRPARVSVAKGAANDKQA